MSTTFDVYPGKREIPTFASLLYRSTAELHKFLESVGVKARPCIHLRLQRRKDHAHASFRLSDEARWSKDLYAWFMVGEVAGGTDAYFNNSPNYLREIWDEEM